MATSSRSPSSRAATGRGRADGSAARRTQPTRPGRAVVYCRVSTDEQGDSGLGLEAQEATCRRWAEYRDVEVVAVTHDVCSGARPPADRPGFAAALALLEAGEADALVCAKLDRATRRQRGLLDLLDLAEAHGFALVLLDVDLDTSTPIGRAILGILSVVAELEREQTRQRTKAALAAKRARGQRQGPGPLLDDDRRRWIAEQVERHGRSRKGLAAELNQRGVPTATGRGRWYPSTIAGVLASVAYERELDAARIRSERQGHPRDAMQPMPYHLRWPSSRRT